MRAKNTQLEDKQKPKDTSNKEKSQTVKHLNNKISNIIGYLISKIKFNTQCANCN